MGKGLSAGTIAKHCGVSDMLVLAIKKKMAEQCSGPRILDLTEESLGDENVTGEDGKKYPAKKPTTKVTTSETTTTITVVETPTEADFVEEHEEPKTTDSNGPVTDGLGQPLSAAAFLAVPVRMALTVRAVGGEAQAS